MFSFSLFHVFISFYFIRRNTRTPRKMSASEVSVSRRTPISFLNIFKAVQGYFDVIVDQPIRKQDWGHVASEMESSGGDWLTAQELKIT